MSIYRDRLDAKDVRTLLLWLAAGVLGTLVAVRFFFVAFPEASVDFRVSRPAALEAARKFLTAQKFPLENYQSSIVFQVEDTSKTYLERELGLEQANRLMAGEVSVWFWDVRFFRPKQEEEFRLRLSPAGRVAGLSHTIEEARAGARLEREAARAIAEDFLRGPLQIDLAAQDYLAEEANSVERPNRRDWSFTWERRGFKAKDAPYRLRVTVVGDRAGGYEEFLKVPEAWRRDFERLRSSNIFYQWTAQVPYAFLQGAVFVILFNLGRRGLIRWRSALQLGVVLALLFLAMNVNEWPLSRHGYDTNSDYTGFFAEQLILAVVGSLLLGMLVALTVAAAEPLYRRLVPEKLRLDAVLAPRLPAGEGLPEVSASFRFPGLRSKEFFSGCVIGLAMAAAHIGFVVAFYVLGQKFGFWLPQEVKYTNAVSTAIPWIYPLAISIYAATSEEFLFRLFAIPFLLRLTRSKFVALVLPALVWGFLHSAYPVQPGYARGVEVGIIGIVAGWVMLRWGIFATLVWHYTVDALLIGLFLLRSESLYFFVSGLVVVAAVLIPLGISAGFWVRNRGFLGEEALFNRADPLVSAEPAVEEETAPVVSTYESVRSGTMRLALVAGLAGYALFAAYRPATIGDFLSTSITPAVAEQKAAAVLQARGVDPLSFRRVASFVSPTDEIATEYLRRKVGVEGVNRIYRERVPPALWRVRHFRDSEKEEYHVVLRADGSLHAVHHLVDEKAPGANLPKEEAQARAEEFLRTEKKLDLAKWRLVEANSEKRPERTDHTFVWEELEPLAVGGAGEDDKAFARVELKVIGDELSGFRIFIKIPDEWRRKHTEFSLPVIAFTIFRIVFYAGLAVTVIVIFFMNLKQANVPWQRMARWASWAALSLLVSLIAGFPELVNAYDTQMPYRTFMAIVLMGQFLILALGYSGVFFLFGLAWFFLSRALGSERLPSWSGMPAAYFRDAFWLAIAGTGVLLGLGRLRPLLASLWPVERYATGVAIPGSLDSLLPAAGVAAGAVTGALFLAALLSLVAGVLAGYARALWMQFAFLFLLAFALAGRWGSPAHLLQNLLLQFVALVVIWWGVRNVFRWNLLAYFLVAALLSLSGGLQELLRQPNLAYRLNGFALAGVAIALLAWPLVARPRTAEAPSPPFSDSSIG